MTCALYRHFDASGTLLYVGISATPDKRLYGHSKSSSWAGRIANVSIEWFAKRDDARAAETRAILIERPSENIMSCPRFSGDDASVRVLHLRALSGLTQKEFAEMIGVKRARLSLWECGSQRLSLSGALELHRVFGVSLDWLYLGVEPKGQHAEKLGGAA